ncbi:maleylacetoacetate isomerase [Asticcacaulis sp. EMRT-3]|uniref:maleylacetoacetate isomerase n=1 Tax=Asticcacaulis sp. EMRT-3 TaxID=3040349 RepID=UPI0024AEADDD|nr:maleylacetoacetate isomerase [Asticcacaulis sp. EMRT-3]MDI7773930.1 maleylacetoacetate isomerase [Asticcacaulis sp. EMRT-3]
MLILHSYWRSTAAYRVRIALNLKGLDYRQVAHNLRANAHHDEAYRALNPQMMVPALEAGDGAILTQSPAILEWLEETHPLPPLLPSQPEARAVVRAMSALIACDIHPLNSLRVLRELKHEFSADETRRNQWAVGWIAEGFTALETLVEKHGRGFCFGDTPGLADAFLVPQVFSAQAFGVDLRPYPAIRAVNTACDEHPAFVRAHPRHQPDADTVNA